MYELYNCSMNLLDKTFLVNNRPSVDLVLTNKDIRVIMQHHANNDSNSSRVRYNNIIAIGNRVELKFESNRYNLDKTRTLK